MMAVGIGNYNMNELRMIATDPDKHVFNSTDFDHLSTLVKNLRTKACTSK
jgi:hypothetical protein